MVGWGDEHLETWGLQRLHPPDLDGQTSRQPSWGAPVVPEAPVTEPLEGDRPILGEQGLPNQTQLPEDTSCPHHTGSTTIKKGGSS